MKFRKIFLLAMSCFTLAGCDFSGFTKNLDDKEEDPEVQREDDYYTVSFYGYQNELLETQQVLEGKQPVFPDYNEVILMGDYSLNFVGWSETFPRGVYSDTSVYAEFKAEYTVTFYNKDNTIYKQMFAMEGDPAPDIPGLPNYADPNDSNYDYKFIYWEFKSGIQNGYVVGNVQAYPVFQRTQSRFLVNFFNYNGTLLYSNYTDRDGKIVYNGPTPIKQADEEGYYYEFTGWSEDLNHITSNTNVEATFERKKHKIGYKVDDMTQYDNG